MSLKLFFSATIVVAGFIPAKSLATIIDTLT